MTNTMTRIYSASIECTWVAWKLLVKESKREHEVSEQKYKTRFENDDSDYQCTEHGRTRTLATDMTRKASQSGTCMKQLWVRGEQGGKANNQRQKEENHDINMPFATNTLQSVSISTSRRSQSDSDPDSDSDSG